LKFLTPNDPEWHGDRGKLLDVPRGAAGAAGQAGVPGVGRLDPAEGPGDAARDGAGRRVDEHLGVVFPADGEMVFEHGYRVQVGGRAGGLVEQLHRADPVDAVRPPGARGAGLAQQVPPAVAHDDRPRIDLADPLGAGFGPIAEPDPPAVRAGLHERCRGLRVGPGGRAVGHRPGGQADGLRLGRHRLRERTHDLAERAAHQAGGITRVVVAVEHGHDQAEGLGGAEHQRRQPQAAAEAVAAVGPADGFDRDLRLAQDADVAPGRPLRDAELAGQPVRGDAGAGLDQFQRQQRPRRGARLGLHRHLRDPEAERPG
jgi:hypothetical protein